MLAAVNQMEEQKVETQLLQEVEDRRISVLIGASTSLGLLHHVVVSLMYVWHGAEIPFQKISK